MTYYVKEGIGRSTQHTVRVDTIQQVPSDERELRARLQEAALGVRTYVCAGWEWVVCGEG